MTCNLLFSFCLFLAQHYILYLAFFLPQAAKNFVVLCTYVYLTIMSLACTMTLYLNRNYFDIFSSVWISHSFR